MKRSYLLSRLLLAALALGVMVWRLDRLAHQTLVEAGEAFLGSDVKVGTVRTSLTGLTLKLRNVAAAHPTAGDRNLVECDEAVFHLDASAASRRRFVVRDGRISGLKFNTSRTDAGPTIELETMSPTATMPAVQLGGLEQFANPAGVAPASGELTAVEMARALETRWTKSWQVVESGAEALAKRAAELQHELELARRYPLKAQEKWRMVASQSDEVAAELEAIQTQLMKLRDQAATDQVALTAAWKTDQQKLQAGAPAGQFDPDQLTTLMLGAENAVRVEKTLACVRWLRQQATLPAAAARGQRVGTSVFIPGARRGPEFLIESVALSGETEFAGRMVAWEGTASGITTDPQKYGRPAVLRLIAGEPYPMTLEGIFDRTGEIAKDRVAIDCPLTPLGQRTLGDRRHLALAVAPANAQIRVVVELLGERLHGEIVCKQERVALEVASIDQRLAPSQELLQAAAGTVQCIESRVELSGTLTRPAWKLRSDLGLHLANSFREVLQRQFDTSREAALQAARQELAVEVEKLDHFLVDEQERVAGSLASAKAVVETLQLQIAERQGRLNGDGQTLRR